MANDIEGLRALAKELRALRPTFAQNGQEKGWVSAPAKDRERAEAIDALLSELEAVKGERDRFKAGLAYVLDHAVYGDSYGVHGSDFEACHFCQGGGSPGVALTHAEDCPISRYPDVVSEWFEEMAAERQDREAAEAALEAVKRELANTKYVLEEIRAAHDVSVELHLAAEAALVSLKGGGGSSCTNLDSSPSGATDSQRPSEGEP